MARPVISLALVRHGETAATEAAEVCGRSDPPLSPLGRDTVARLAASPLWQSLVPGIDELWCSPLQRTRQTVVALDPPERLAVPRLDDRLVELDFGRWEGLAWHEVHRRWPEALAHWSDDWIARAPPDGECFHALVERVAGWFASWRRRERSAIVVTHGGCIRALVCVALDRPLDQAMELRVDPASLHLLELDPVVGAVHLRHANRRG